MLGGGGQPDLCSTILGPGLVCRAGSLPRAPQSHLPDWRGEPQPARAPQSHLLAWVGPGGGGSHSLPSVPQPYLLRGGGESAGRTARPVFHNPTSCLQPACRGPEEGDNLPCAPQSPGARETQLPPCSTTLSPGRGSLSRGRGHSLPRGPQSWGTVNSLVFRRGGRRGQRAPWSTTPSPGAGAVQSAHVGCPALSCVPQSYFLARPGATARRRPVFHNHTFDLRY